MNDVSDRVRNVSGVPVLAVEVTAESVDALRSLGDQLRDKINGVVVLAAKLEGKALLLVMADKASVAKGIHSGKVVKELATICGGGGGGRPDMAQAGAKDVAKITEALQAAYGIIENMLK